MQASRYFAGLVLLVLHFGLCSAVPLSLNLTDTANSTATQLSIPTFRVDVRPDYSKNLSPLAMYTNAINAMAVLAVRDQGATFNVAHWSLPEFDMWIYFSSLDGTRPMQIRFAVWGLLSSFLTIDRFKHFHPTVVLMYVQDEAVGRMEIDSLPPPSPSAVPSSHQQNFDLGDSPSAFNKSQDLGSFSDLGEGFKIFYNYDGVALHEGSFFVTVLSAMKDAAGGGADGRCPELTARAVRSTQFSIKSEKDRFGNALLRYRDVVRLLRKITFQMLSNHRVAEITIVLKVDGVKVAEGSFRKMTAPHGIADGLGVAK